MRRQRQRLWRRSHEDDEIEVGIGSGAGNLVGPDGVGQVEFEFGFGDQVEDDLGW